MPFFAALLSLLALTTPAFATDTKEELRELSDMLKKTTTSLIEQQESAALVSKSTSIGGKLDTQAQTLISQMQRLQSQIEDALNAQTPIEHGRFIDSAYVLSHRSSELRKKLQSVKNETNSANKRLDRILDPYLKALNESPNKALIREARFERFLILNDYLAMRIQLDPNKQAIKTPEELYTLLDYEWRDVLATLEPTLYVKDTLPVAQTELLQTKLRHAIALSLLPAHANFLATKTNFIDAKRISETTKWLKLPAQAFAFRNTPFGKGILKQPILSILTWGFNLLVGLPIGGAMSLYSGNATAATIGLFSAHIAVTALALPLALVAGMNQIVDMIFAIPENLMLLRREKDLIARIQTLQKNPILAGLCADTLTQKELEQRSR